jgi:hypothetical protein
VRDLKANEEMVQSKTIEDRRKFVLSKPYKKEDADKDMELTPEYDTRIYNVEELNLIFTNISNAERVFKNL